MVVRGMIIVGREWYIYKNGNVNDRDKAYVFKYHTKGAAAADAWVWINLEQERGDFSTQS